ncbi:hypothetical protein DB88DRAFT_477765 [Papiliotrema laurentii]|uniref:Uncharacterized protein n=1 Tax=Papiliotrema laurentii TaxID=5418 RepID=A0AAD9L9B9_PAPLA|nr:hypothetical protein DB88DRAFT_477765 [Papiliotrema laurentii]
MSDLRKAQTDEWEWASGAPKFIDKEQEYPPAPSPPGIPIGTAVHREKAESLPAPGARVTFSGTRSPTLRGERDGRERIASGSDKRLQARRDEIHRTHPPQSASMIHLSAEGYDEAVNPQREATKDPIKRSPPKLPQIARLSRIEGSSHTAADVTVPSPPSSAGTPTSPYVKLGRPPAMRRHTSQDVGSVVRNPSSSTLQPDKRERLVSTPSPTRKSVMPPLASPSLPSSHRPPPRSVMEPESPAQPTPSIYQPSTPPSGTIRTKRDAPPGYISPISDDMYDRYSTHPAAPQPDRSDRHGSQRMNHSSSGSTGDGFHYLPPGYARPTKDLEWNRDGPAMKTYGIAWKRHRDDIVLPHGPAGPRWVQAKPPRAAVVMGGGWWESGGAGM